MMVWKENIVCPLQVSKPLTLPLRTSVSQDEGTILLYLGGDPLGWSTTLEYFIHSTIANL